MGGKKNKALYFVGYEGNGLIFLDPHYVNDAIQKRDVEEFDVSSYTCKTPKKLDMSSLDPCLSVGFLVKTADDFISLKNDLKKLKEDFKDASIVSIY
jgi:cysteine protease ATG4